MEQAWMLEMTHLDSGDITVRLVDEYENLTEWIANYFGGLADAVADHDNGVALTLEEISSSCDSVREWSLRGSDNERDDYDIEAILMPIERSI